MKKFAPAPDSIGAAALKYLETCRQPPSQLEIAHGIGRPTSNVCYAMKILVKYGLVKADRVGRCLRYTRPVARKTDFPALRATIVPPSEWGRPGRQSA